MKNILIGNGININFGGNAYNSFFIVERMKNNLQLNRYDFLFDNKITTEEMLTLLTILKDECNEILLGKYDLYITRKEEREAFDDLKRRYSEVKYISDIAMEDLFFIISIILNKIKSDGGSISEIAVKQGLERMLLDCIFNKGKIQELYKKMPEKFVQFINDFDNIFTLNYDNNLEKITCKKIYHLHGDYSIKADSENESTIQGDYRKKVGIQLNIPIGYEHCFSNALMDYSGDNKNKLREFSSSANAEFDKLNKMDKQEALLLLQVKVSKENNNEEYNLLQNKIENPKLTARTDYFYMDFINIEDELHILGMSPNNDGHIFEAIKGNDKIKKVIYYFTNEDDKKIVENTFISKTCEFIDVFKFWEEKGCQKQIKYFTFKNDKVFNKIADYCKALMKDHTPNADLLKECNKIDPKKFSYFYNRIVKEERIKNLPNDQFVHACHEIALEEGIHAATLIEIYTYYTHKHKK